MKRTPAETRGFLQTNAERMRRWPTKAEETIRPWLTMLGFEFQHPFGHNNAILDFYHKGYKIAVEIDGGYHKKRQGPDARRDRRLRKYAGITTLRFTNKRVLEDTEACVREIREKAAQIALEAAGL